MKQLNDAEVLARYHEVLDSVAAGGEEVVILRDGHAPVVMVALADYEALKETVHLLRSPANAERLLDAMSRLDANAPRRKNILITLRDAATQTGGVGVVISPRDSPTRPVDLS